MAAAVLGNLALLPDSSVPSRKRDPSAAVASTASADRRRPEAAAPRNPNRFLSCSLSAGGDVSRPPTPPPPLHRRRRGRLGPAATSPSSSSGGDDDWEKELRNRLKELEEMKELEKRAEELQSRRAAIEAEGEKDESEEEKRERVRRELEKLAKEQAQRRETAKLMFELGQKAYGKGMYARAIEFLEAALTIIPRPTFFGGEIQIWLAMAYEANNRHRDCIALYQQLEKKHPSVSIRRQAAELRYILQAPKLKISKDEMVTIPLIGSSYDRIIRIFQTSVKPFAQCSREEGTRNQMMATCKEAVKYAGTWTGKYKDRDQRRKTGSTADQLPPSRDFFGDFMLWRPPVGLEKSPAFWVVVALWAGLLGTAVLLQR